MGVCGSQMNGANVIVWPIYAPGLWGRSKGRFCYLTVCLFFFPPLVWMLVLLIAVFFGLYMLLSHSRFQLWLNKTFDHKLKMPVKHLWWQIRTFLTLVHSVLSQWWNKVADVTQLAKTDTLCSAGFQSLPSSSYSIFIHNALQCTHSKWLVEWHVVCVH